MALACRAVQIAGIVARYAAQQGPTEGGGFGLLEQRRKLFQAANRSSLIGHGNSRKMQSSSQAASAIGLAPDLQNHKNAGSFIPSMQPQNDSIGAIETRLQGHSAAKEQLRELDAIRTNVQNKLTVLGGLRVEIGGISNQLHYYDMVDYLGNSQKSNINLKSAGVYLRELSEAAGLFEQDGDAAYARKAEDIRRKLLQHGLAAVEGYFMQERYRDPGLRCFLDQAAREEAEHVYFRCRRKTIASKISECIKDIRKNYKLFITGEASAYGQAFGADQGDLSNGSRVFPQNTEDLAGLDKFLYEVFSEIFRNTGHEAVRSLIDDESEHDLRPNQTLRNMANIFYRAPTSAKQHSQEHYAL